jgi:hypothetical protein
LAYRALELGPDLLEALLRGKKMSRSDMISV